MTVFGLFLSFTVSNFNSHAHVERDVLVSVYHFDSKYFNSHAHVERDKEMRSKTIESIISTHTLTWSVT